MKFNIKDYKEVVSKLNYFVEVESKMKIEGKENWIIEFKNKMYMISNNGGETNVSAINFSKSVSIAHTSNKFEVSALVLAYRIGKLLEEGWSGINWNINHDDIIEVLDQYKSREAIMYAL
ncbi:MAG: hypothetical protein AWU54_452 [Candidatus Frackibacter sp. T328-2]|nr:MAG: hypothetical protein AWU54_452 [Candidatus Frackibacter sp. T328-2]